MTTPSSDADARRWRPSTMWARLAASGLVPRASTAAHVVMIAAVGALVTKLEYKAGASLGEDGTRFALAGHLLDGRIPYRTLLTYRPPGAYSFDAIVMGLGGRSLGSQHLASFISGEFVYPLLTYVAARTILRRAGMAALAAILVALLVTPVPGVQLACALTAFVLAARWVRTGAGSTLFAAGVAAGAEVAFGLDLAGATLVAVPIVAWARALATRRTPTGTMRVPTLQPLAAFFVGAALGTAPLLTALALDGGIGNFLRYVANAARRAASGNPIPSPSLSVASLRFYVPLLVLPMLLTVLCRAARDEGMRDRALIGVLLTCVTTLRMASATVTPDDAHLAAALADVPLLAMWIAEWIVASRGRIQMHRWDVSLALGLGLPAAALWRMGDGRPAFALLACAASLAAAGIAVGPRFAPAGPVGQPRRVVRITALTAVLVALPLALILAPGRLVGSPPAGTRLSGADWDPALGAEVRAALSTIREARPETLFVFPSGGALYELSRLGSATSFVALDGDVEPWEVRRALAELRAQAPDTVVVRYRQAGDWSNTLAPITSWLEDRYVEARRLDRPELWGVWVRRDPGDRCRRLTLYPFARGASRGLAPTLRDGGREQNVLVQRVASARFSAELDRGSFIRFAIERSSTDPGAERSVDVLAGGHRVEVWKGQADGVARRIVLPPLADTKADVVLLSPPGATTLWDEPVVCSPA